MAVNPIHQKYFNDLVAYYNLAPDLNLAQQQANQQQPLGGGFLPRVRVNFPPVIGGFGGNSGGAGYNVNVIGGAEVLGQVREHQREDREENRATSATWIGAILTIIGSAGLACVVSSWNETSERLEAARDFKNDQIQFFPEQDRPNLIQGLNKHIKNLEKKNSSIRNIVILTATALASTATAFVAGMFAIQWLITASIVVGVATLAVGTFFAVLYCLQKPEEPTEFIEYLRAHPQDLQVHPDF